ncbi:hypothetical protein B5F77_10480 [Parabacteroides sp. An277]|uniref:DUF6261 family protein n=1 Tax=Parabacteroides sp. An277 TaxID=1965619 RepID=UPI000B37CC2C|nr:DUF6261 family protein [Parabacteroides sp. An277]OUO51447.1 hypothetical protein B5F77_10480 [Parabacteroides sp. An277]
MEIKKIIVDIPLYEMRNLEHYELCANVKETVTPELAEQLHLTPLLTPFLEWYAVEEERTLERRAYKNTDAIKEADRRRDELFLVMKRSIETAKLLPIEAKKQAAQHLSFVQKPYLGAARRSYMQETAFIRDYVEKMRDEANAADVETLGLTEILGLLEEANSHFSDLYNERSGEILKRNESETIQSVRPKVDEAFKQLVYGINALYVVNELKEKDTETRDTLGRIIDQINSDIIQWKKNLIRAGVIRPRKKDKKIETAGDGAAENPA